MKIHCQTERLILREINSDDLQDLFELDSDPEVHRYLGNNPFTDLKQSDDVVNSLKDQYRKNGIGRWAVILRETGEFLGWAGLKYEKDARPGMQFFDLGYRLKQKYWGQGYATEAAIASRDYFFTKMNGNILNAGAHIENIASNRILRKIGMTLDETFIYDGAEHNWYTMERTSWEQIIKEQ